jgi:hypothetical protein
MSKSKTFPETVERRASQEPLKLANQRCLRIQGNAGQAKAI